MTLLWLRLAVILYGVAALAVLPAALYNRPRWRHIAVPAAFLGAFFHFVSITETLYAAHRALPVDTHETLSMLGLLLVVGFLILAARYRTVSFGIFLLPIAVLLAIVPAFHPGHEEIAYPLVRTGWILLHIALLLAAYAAMFLSLIASLLYLIQERRLKEKRGVLRGPQGAAFDCDVDCVHPDDLYPQQQRIARTARGVLVVLCVPGDGRGMGSELTLCRA